MQHPRPPYDQRVPDPPRGDEREARPIPHGHAQILAASLGMDLFCRTLAHEAPDAIIFADVGGMIRFWNRGAERVFRYPAAEALGKSLDIIIPTELRPRHWKAYADTMRTGETRYGAGEVLAVPGMRKDGSTVPIEFTLLPFHDRVGHVLGVAAILRDASKHAAEMEALRSELTTARKAGPGG